MSGGYAKLTMWENEKVAHAMYWIGADYPEAETYTGELLFVDAEQKPMQISEVGPVTFSEGVHMASQIFAKRKVEEGEA